MPSVVLDYASSVYLPVKICAPVAVQLSAAWSARTQSNTTTVVATVANTGRVLGPNMLRGLFGGVGNVRGDDIYQYPLEFDLNQFITNPATGAPWTPTCADIVSVDPWMLGLTAAGGGTTAPVTVQFPVSLARAAGVYDIFTAVSSATILNISYYVNTAAVGLTSISIATNEATPTTLLASTPAASLTTGAVLPEYNGPLLLPATKKAQITIVGPGSAGLLTLTVTYQGGLLV